MELRSVIEFGIEHPVLAEVLSNGVLTAAVIFFIFFCFFVWRKKGSFAAFHMATVGALSALASYGICDLIKRTNPTPRPFAALNMPPAFPEADMLASFPSAHSAIVTAVVVILLLEWRHRRDRLSAVISAVLILLVPLVWAGRIIAGHHYPIDVFVGSFIGGLVSYIIYRAIEKYRN